VVDAVGMVSVVERDEEEEGEGDEQGEGALPGGEHGYGWEWE
jgi:hypothetical protein